MFAFHCSWNVTLGICQGHTHGLRVCSSELFARLCHLATFITRFNFLWWRRHLRSSTIWWCAKGFSKIHSLSLSLSGQAVKYSLKTNEQNSLPFCSMIIHSSCNGLGCLFGIIFLNLWIQFSLTSNRLRRQKDYDISSKSALYNLDNIVSTPELQLSAFSRRAISPIPILWGYP